VRNFLMRFCFLDALSIVWEISWHDPSGGSSAPITKVMSVINEYER